MTYQAKRRIVRITLLILFFLLPFIDINGAPLLRLDFHKLHLFVFGGELSSAHIFPIVLISLSLFFFFILATQLFGRVWCGWLCPQTILIECSKRNIIKPLLTIAIAFGLSNIVVGIPYVIWVIVALVLLVDLLFIGRRFCKTVCPYANFQSVMYDADTMRIGLLPNKESDCIDCGACVEVCQTEIDIREGLNNKCVACAACIDACPMLCLGHFYGKERFQLFAANKIITFAIALAFLIAGLVAISNIGDLRISNVHNDEFTITSNYAKPVVIRVEGSHKSHTLEKGESITVQRHDRERTPTVHIYQGREEFTQIIRLE